MTQLKRTAHCGELRAADAGKTVILNGWVDAKRAHGGVSFINLRDRYGKLQLVVDAEGEDGAALDAICAELRNEFCIAAVGLVRLRPAAMANQDMPTGEVEALVSKLVILGRCETPPFQIEDETNAKEELRLRFRYLDLRSGGMQRRIALRGAVSFAVREFLTGQGFCEIETPTFIRSTPEGARDYLVPSRLYAGKFYALPQSPQLYKQLLMVAGFDKYFQLARCYRDEDARGDRQPEFTQIDIEMSFVGRDDVLSLTESLMGFVFKKTLAVELPARFRRLAYDEAVSRFGSDKPDLRFGLELQDFAPFAAASAFGAFKGALSEGQAAREAAAAQGVTKQGGAVKALVVPGKADYSRRQIEELEAQSKVYKAKGMAWMKVAGTEAAPVLEGGVAKFFAPQADAIAAALGAKPGDLILIVADADARRANIALGAVRSKLARDLALCDPARFEFVWIVDFPLFEYNDDEKRWEAAHHPFSHPQDECLESLERDPGAAKGDLYDLVLNGYELASGSIRIHDGDLQKRIFRIVGLSDEEAEKRFGFFTQAFKYGAPPHGGIAPGLDRLVMLMAGKSSIKEVIAFPKNSFAENPMDGSPGELDAHQLEELHLAVRDKTKD
ncbi:MAG: aspartate--tRNA ligase [Spirochaetaceae bacterium]|jgi:aspartyl-tRNA synthetase|nr:aspartate--tRNA ligase [Spirochaetaceae bacterium]